MPAPPVGRHDVVTDVAADSGQLRSQLSLEDHGADVCRDIITGPYLTHVTPA